MRDEGTGDPGRRTPETICSRMRENICSCRLSGLSRSTNISIGPQEPAFTGKTKSAGPATVDAEFRVQFMTTFWSQARPAVDFKPVQHQSSAVNNDKSGAHVVNRTLPQRRRNHFS